MSAKKSWDIAPKSRPQPAPQPEARKDSRERPVIRATVRNVPRPTARTKERLRDRRKKQRRSVFVVFLIFILLLIAAAFYALWQPYFRIETVNATDPHQAEIILAAQTEIAGTYWHLLPKNSIFLYPQNALRASLLAAFPDIEALSIRRESFSAISITPTARVSAFLWCGDMPSSSGVPSSCYNADAAGFIFDQVSSGASLDTNNSTVPATATSNASSTASSTITKIAPKISYGSLVVYSALAETATSTGVSATNPIGLHVEGASHIPAALEFIKILSNLGVQVTSLVIRDDEADVFTSVGTRITYVLGREVDAAALAQAVLPKLNLSDGNVEYLDLRFAGKAYLKRKNQAVLVQ
jgi:hypothetical protein